MRKRIKKALAYVLSTTLTLGLFTFVVPKTAITAKAATTKSAGNTSFGLGELANEVNDYNQREVYFDGNGDTWYVIGYNGAGIASTAQTATEEGDITLLFADSMGNSKFSDTSDVYADSLLKTFIDSEISRFTDSEKAAVKRRNLVTGTFEDQPFCDGVSGTQVDGAFMWPLSTNEAFNLYYVYKDSNYSGLSGNWWLRSPGFYDANDPSGSAYRAAFVEPGSAARSLGEDINNEYLVRPALNINLSSILFTTKIQTAYVGYRYKFTLIDDTNLSAAITPGFSIYRSGSTVTVPYTVSGGPDRISIIITDKEYTEADAVIKYYGELSVNGSLGTSGKGKFTLPGSFNSSTDKVYMIAEYINDDNLTDYACTPVSLPVSNLTNYSYYDDLSYPFPRNMSIQDFMDRTRNTGSPDAPGYIKVGRDIELSANYGLDNRYIDLDLNSHSFVETATKVMGNDFEITDDSVIKLINGSISGIKGHSFATQPGVIVLRDNATLILEDFSFTGSIGYGIALYDNSKLIIRDGSVIENCSEYCIYAEDNASVILEGGTIVLKEGGGVSLNDNATFTMRDGVIRSDSIWYDENKGVKLKDNSLYKYYGGTIEGTFGSFYYSSESDSTVVTYMPNYPGDSAEYRKAVKKSGFKLDPKFFERTGLAVGSWNTQSDGGGTSYRYDAEVAFDSETTLYAIWTDVFDINYDTDGGLFTSNCPVSYSYGDSVSLPTANDIEKNGYTFEGWYADKNLSGSKITSISASEYGHKYLYANWTVNDYTVNLVTNGGTINANNVTGYTYGIGAVLPDANDISLTGNTFAGWYEDEFFTGNPVTEITDTDYGNKTYYAKWTLDTYNVNLVTNGGTIKSNNVTEYTYYTGATLPTANDIEKTGYTFEGWFDNSSFTGNPVTLISDTETGDKTFYAKWSPNSYTVKFDANGGSGTMSDQARIYDDGVALTANVFTYDGYTFAGWNTAVDGSGTGYADGAVANLTGTGNGTVTLYAQWTTNKYVITWVNFDGTILETDSDVKYGSMPSYDGEEPSRPGTAKYSYKFTGWTPEIKPVTESATYEAVYSETLNKYMITFEDEDGTILQQGELEYGEIPVYSGETPKKAAEANREYVFAGWDPEITTVTGPAVYKAKYTENVNAYTITFDANGGSVTPASMLTNAEFKLDSLPVPVYEGFNFIGWFTTAEGGEQITTDTVFTSDQTVYAHWEEKEEPEEPEEPQNPDYLAELRLRLAIAIELGGKQVVYWDKGTALPYDVMKTLEDNPDITLIFEYTYEDVNYIVTLSGDKVKAFEDIPWYGPLYLYGTYKGTIK